MLCELYGLCGWEMSSSVVEDTIKVIWKSQIQNPGVVAPNDLAEYGALAIAFYLIHQYSDFQVVEQSVIGTGFDYWLGYKHQIIEQDSNNFLQARLEVSGILVGNERTIMARVRKKSNKP